MPMRARMESFELWFAYELMQPKRPSRRARMAGWQYNPELLRADNRVVEIAGRRDIGAHQRHIGAA
jgi:hypothetical protein